MKKILLKEKLLELNIFSEKKLPAMIMLGEILINGKVASSLFEKINTQDVVTYKQKIPKYVSRGGFKIEAALDYFNISPKGLVCVDFGASTGGFTDCLLQKEAIHVFAVEKGKKQLAQKLINNPKVTSIEGFSLFDLNPEYFNKKIDLAVCDLSFIPLKRGLQKMFELSKKAPLIALLKPHYEAQDLSLLRNGVVKDEITRKSIVQDFCRWLSTNNFSLKGILESPVKGGGRNIEYLVYICSD